MDEARILARLSKIESYLVSVARALPKIDTDEIFLKYIRSILLRNSPDARLVREAFGLPLNPKRSRSLAVIMAVNTDVSAPLISLLAQRFYHFIWRFQFTLREINDSYSDKSDLLAKVAQLCTLCLNYVLAQRPSLLDLAGSISRPMPESAADPSLYTTLRALEYEREDTHLTGLSERDTFRKSALNFISSWLEQALQGKQKVDDPSNAWWALYEGLRVDPVFFSPLVERLIDKFALPKAPAQEIIKKGFVPEIYTESRCAAYIISNIHGIFREGPALDSKVEKRLDSLLIRTVKNLMESADSKNLYLASVHYAGLNRALSFSAEKQFREMRQKGKIILADFKPIGDFVCVEPEITRKIKDLRDSLKAIEAKKGRTVVLVYGASSTGKSFLVEQFFKDFNRGPQYKTNQLICDTRTNADDIREHVIKVSADTATGMSTPFLLLDEFDVEMASSLYPTLLVLLDKGSLDKHCELKSFVLFLAGGKHGSVDALRQFLAANQNKRKYQKGLDVYNRTSPAHKISLPVDLYRNKNLRMMVGLSVLLEDFGPSMKVSEGLLLHIREMRVDQGEGVRQFKGLKHVVTKHPDGTLVLKDDPNPEKPISVEAAK